eukprot:5646598-Alexandrium_andersonii.AAC.1
MQACGFFYVELERAAERKPSVGHVALERIAGRICISGHVLDRRASTSTADNVALKRGTWISSNSACAQSYLSVVNHRSTASARTEQ